MQNTTDARMDKRSVFKAIFYFLLARLGVRRLRGARHKRSHRHMKVSHAELERIMQRLSEPVADF